MGIRAGMTDLIDQLRLMTQAGTADYTVNSITYWSDDQLQDTLDRSRADFREPMGLRMQYDNGTARYYDYYFASSDVERISSGTAAWRVETSNGSVAGTSAYSVDYNGRRVSFTSDTAGTIYYLWGRRYNLNRAAYEVWTVKAAHYAGQFDITTDNHSLKRSQLLQQARDMVAFYRDQSAMGVTRLERTDIW
jgi:hypothetical protein